MMGEALLFYMEVTGDIPVKVTFEQRLEGSERACHYGM